VNTTMTNVLDELDFISTTVSFIQHMKG
jgi:hypothetical protein